MFTTQFHKFAKCSGQKQKPKMQGLPAQIESDFGVIRASFLQIEVLLDCFSKCQEREVGPKDWFQDHGYS